MFCNWTTALCRWCWQPYCLHIATWYPCSLWLIIYSLDIWIILQSYLSLYKNHIFWCKHKAYITVFDILCWRRMYLWSKMRHLPLLPVCTHIIALVMYDSVCNCHFLWHCVMGCSDVLSGWHTHTFQLNLLPPSSGLSGRLL